MFLMGARTQKRLATLLVALIESENKVENCRVQLCSQNNIDFFSIFQLIDFQKRGFFKNEELVDFMCKNNVYSTTREIQFLINCLDCDSNSVVTYDNFLFFLLPKQNEKLRKEVLARDKIQAEKQQSAIQSEPKMRQSKVSFSPQTTTLGFNPKPVTQRSPDKNTLSLSIQSSNERQVQPEIEFLLVKLFNQIIQNFKSVEAKKEILHASNDFQMAVAFKTIDTSQIYKLDYESLEEFLVSQGEKVQEKDLLVLIRQFGSLNDGFINEAQFMEMILPMEFTRKKNAVQSSFSKAKKIDKTIDQVAIKSRDPLSEHKKVVNFQSEAKDPLKQTTQNGFATTQILSSSKIQKSTVTLKPDGRSSMAAGSQYSIGKSGQSRAFNKTTSQFGATAKKPLSRGMLTTPWSKKFERTIQSKTGGSSIANLNYMEDDAIEYEEARERYRCSAMKGDEEENFVKKMYELLQSDLKVEELKQELASQRDFNLLDSFQFLDLQCKGNITPPDLYVNLKRLNLNPTKEQIYLFYKQYDLDFSGRLEFSEFVKTFIPIEQDYRNLLNNRSSTGNGFSEETKQLLKQTFQAILLNSQNVEQIRQQLNRRRLFNTYDAFCALDQDSNGYITLEDVRTLFLDYDIHFSPKEIQYFFRRFDKGLDGEVCYGEFFSELTPKCPFQISETMQTQSPSINQL